MIRIKNIRLVLAGALIVPVAIASIACSPIYADDPNGGKREIFTPELDLEALNGKIQSAVESGEISQAQVDTAIGILKRRLSESHKAGFGPGWDLEEIKAKISAAVESGGLTQEEADEKLAGLEEGMEKGQKLHGKRGHHYKKPLMNIEEIRAKISAAVESGEITQEEADEKLADIETKRNERQEKMAAKLEEIKTKISAAVESGEITQAEADEKLAGLEERKEKGWIPQGKRGQHHKKPFMDIEEIKAKVSAAVESGEITQEEADEKLFDIEAKRNERQEKMAAKLEEIKARISAAVESGEMTQAEADEKLAGLEERKEKGQRPHGKRGQHHNKPFMDTEKIKAKISGAVESGEITQEEADEKLAGLEERKEKGWRPHAKKGQHHKKPFMDIEEIKAKISAAVESGELSAVEGESKLLYIDGKSKKATYY